MQYLIEYLMNILGRHEVPKIINHSYLSTRLKVLLVGFLSKDCCHYELLRNIMSTNCRIFVLSNALMPVSGCVSDIICIKR